MDFPTDPRRARERETRIVRAFVDLAEGLVGDVDTQDLLHRLAEHCVDILPVTACGVLLTDDRGVLTLLAAHPEAAGVLDLFQVQANEGPCVDCVRTGQPVRDGDLRAGLDRWPRWAPMAVRAGIRSVYATPLRARATVIGSLNLFGSDPDGMSDHDLLIVRALADVATLTVLQERSTDAVTRLNTQLQTALESRVRIEQAKGIIAHALRVDVDRAFQVLRHTSRTTNVKLSTLADRLTGGVITAADLLPLPPPRS